MANINLSIPGDTPICNPQNGRLNQEWRLWFNKLYQRAGGSDAPSNTDLSDIVEQNTTDIDNLKVQVNDNSNAIVTINNQISTINGNLTSLNLQVANLNSSVTTNTANIATLQSQITTANSNISTLQSQMTTANANIATLQTNTIQSVANLGTGTGIFINKTSNTANLKSLKAGTNITLDNTTDPNTIVINSTGGSYTLPIASATTLGGIKVGANLSINATTGVLDSTYSYTLPTASTTVLGGVKVDGTTITISGSGVISASGGGGLTNFTEGNDNTGPNTTRTVSYLRANNTATDVDIALVPKGSGSFSLSIPNNLTSGGNKRGIYSVDLMLNRSNASQVASGIWSSLLGGYYNTASGNASTVVGGGQNTAGADNAGIVGGNNNNITVSDSFTGGGSSLTISTSSFNSGMLGGSTNTIQSNSDNSGIVGGTNIMIKNYAQYSVALGGTLNTNDGSAYSVMLGGNANTFTNSSYSIISGRNNTGFFSAYSIISGQLNTINASYTNASGYCAHTKGIKGAKVRSTLSFTNTSDGKTQRGDYELGAKTSSSSSVDVSTDGSGAGSNNQLVIANNEIKTIKGSFTIRDTTTVSICATYEATVKARNNGGTITILVNNIVNDYIDPSATTNGYSLVASVDTTNNAIKFTASKTGGPDIVAYGSVTTSEFTY